MPTKKAAGTANPDHPFAESSNGRTANLRGEKEREGSPHEERKYTRGHPNSPPTCAGQGSTRLI
jgi:hypothetical protein